MSFCRTLSIEIAWASVDIIYLQIFGTPSRISAANMSKRKLFTKMSLFFLVDASQVCYMYHISCWTYIMKSPIAINIYLLPKSLLITCFKMPCFLCLTTQAFTTIDFISFLSLFTCVCLADYKSKTAFMPKHSIIFTSSFWDAIVSFLCPFFNSRLTQNYAFRCSWISVFFTNINIA